MVDQYSLPGLAPSNGRFPNGLLGACYLVLAIGLVVALAEAPAESVADAPAVEGSDAAAALTAAQSDGGASPAAENDTTAANVTRVVDGDTLDVRYPNGSTDTVELRGVDAPELREDLDPEAFEGVPNASDGRRCLCNAARNATAFLESRVAGETVHLETANASTENDSANQGDAGRLVATVHHDGESVALALVEAGHARVTDPPTEAATQYEDAQERAQQAERGLWSCRISGGEADDSEGSNGTDSAPSGELVVASVHADAAGNDHENPNDEYVAFENAGESELDLSGWMVRDAADHEYVIPDGTTLGPGETVTLYTGSGTDDVSSLYWGQEQAVWNNGGDTIVVSNDAGTEVLSHTYG